MERVGGIIFVKVNSQQLQAKGNFTFSLGKPVASAVVGADAVHGYMERPQVAYIEGEITDSADMSLEALVGTRNATITLELANGKVISLREAFFAGEGVGNTEEGNVAVRFEGRSAEEIR